MKRYMGWMVAAGLVALTGCAGMNANMSTPVADINAGTTVNEKGKVGVAASASKTIDTGLGTKARIGLGTSGRGLRIDAVDEQGNTLPAN